MTSPRPEMTSRQRQVYDFIAERIESQGYPPTIREIGDHMGIRSTNGVADHLKALMRKGFLDQAAASKSRTWRPLPLAAAKAVSARSKVCPSKPRSLVTIPLLGQVAGGAPMLAEERAEDALQVDASLLPRGGEIFALRVAGDSMVDAGIGDGDMVFVQKADTAASGCIVIALIDDEATVKRYHLKGDRVVLKAANKHFRDIVVLASAARQIRIIGVVVGVFRRF